MAKKKIVPVSGQDRRIDHFFSLPGARTDNWRSLHATARKWTRDPQLQSDVMSAFEALGPNERFFAYPGHKLIATLRDRIEGGQAGSAVSLVQRISESILDRTYKEDPGDWMTAEAAAEAPPEINTTTLARGQSHRPYFETLFVAPGAATRADHIIDQIRRLRRPEDPFIYEAVVVGSFEEAICAVLLNPAISALTLYEGFDLETKGSVCEQACNFDPVAGKSASKNDPLTLM